MKAPARINTAPHSNNKEKSKDENGLEKKEERALFKNRISAATILHVERRRKKETAKKRPDLGEGKEEWSYCFPCLSLFRRPKWRDHH